MDKYNTGDILLFSYRGWKSPLDIISHIIEWFSPLPYSHCGIFLKSPTFFNENLTGDYVWESAMEPIPDSEDNIKKCGITLTPIEFYLEKYDGSISIRRLLKKESIVKLKELKIKELQEKVYDKPYDLNPIDWLKELFNIPESNPHNTKSFWCSAFVGYFQTYMGILSYKTEWSDLKPSDLAENNLKFINNYSLDEIKVIKK